MYFTIIFVFILQMKLLRHIILLFSVSLFGQNLIETNFIQEIDLKADTFIGADNFGTIYSIRDYTLYKTYKNKSLNYSNIQLGSISSANTFNPLKINVFYEDFNTVIILDNRLAEVYKIDFNTSESYKNISHVSTGSDNTLWIFNQDTQRLELYDYKTNKTRAKTLPIQSTVIAIASNYNACWALTNTHLLVYNYTGSLLHKIENTNFTSLSENNNRVFLNSEKKLYLLNEEKNDFKLISIPNLLINQFFVTNEIVYIYSENKLYQYQFKID